MQSYREINLDTVVAEMRFIENGSGSSLIEIKERFESIKSQIKVAFPNFNVNYNLEIEYRMPSADDIDKLFGLRCSLLNSKFHQLDLTEQERIKLMIINVFHNHPIDYNDIIAIMKGTAQLIHESTPTKTVDPSIKYIINQNIHLIVSISFDYQTVKGVFLHIYCNFLKLREVQQSAVKINILRLLDGLDNIFYLNPSKICNSDQKRKLILRVPNDSQSDSTKPSASPLVFTTHNLSLLMTKIEGLMEKNEELESRLRCQEYNLNEFDKKIGMKIINDNSDSGDGSEYEHELLMAFLEEERDEMKRRAHSYIYIIEGMDMNTMRRFYKVGETQRHPINRMKEHGLYNRLILMEFVKDSIKVEKDVLKILRQSTNIISRKDLGREYFECKDDDTIKGIIRDYLSRCVKICPTN